MANPIKENTLELQAPGTNLLDLPPELTEAICILVIVNERDVRRNGYRMIHLCQDKSATRPISRVNRRLRHESLPHYFSCTQFAARLDPKDSIAQRSLAKAKLWMATVGRENLKLLQRLCLKGERLFDWICDMDFKNVTLDMMNDDCAKLDMSKIRWCLKRAFLVITKGESWQPTEEGLNVIFRIFAICLKEDLFSHRQFLVGKYRSRADDEKIEELRKRFPAIYPQHVEVDLSLVGRDRKGIRLQMDERTKTTQGWHRGVQMYRYIGTV